MTDVRLIDANSPEALQSKNLLLECFGVDLSDQGAVEHFVGFVDTADTIVVASHPGNSDEIAGVALMSADSKPGDFRIDFIGVAKEARGQGLASALIEFCELRATELGAQRILIQSTIGNGHKIYVGLGYLTTSPQNVVATEKIISFYKDL